MTCPDQLAVQIERLHKLKLAMIGHRADGWTAAAAKATLDHAELRAALIAQGVPEEEL
jgi:hypothetical protein